MPKTSVRNRNLKRINLVEKDRPKRDEARKNRNNPNLTPEQRLEAQVILQKLKRDSSPSRRRNRCKLCSRPRSYNRLTGLCRLHMRSTTVGGMVPGMRKASW